MTEQQKKKIEAARSSMRQMMDTLRPFLPKPDMKSAPPARQWKLDQGLQPTRNHKERESEVVQQF